MTIGRHRFDLLTSGPADGDLVLLLHGWPEFAESWAAVIPQLASRGYRTVSFDQRGYSAGARPAGVGQYSVPHLVADALAVAASQTGDRIHLIGQDWGGIIAWSLATGHPDRLRSLSVLSCPHPAALGAVASEEKDQQDRLDYVRLFRTRAGTAEAVLLAEDGKRLRDAFEGRLPADLVRAKVRRLREPGVLTATLNWYRALGGDLAVPSAGRISTPTLHLWGSEDRRLGRSAVDRTADFVDAPYCLRVVDGAGHWLSEEAPRRVVPPIAEHLGRW